MLNRLIVSLLLLTLGGCVAPKVEKTSANCGLVRVAALPATVTPQRQILVPIGINGQTVMIQIDTGASQSVMFADAVKELGLEPRVVPNIRMVGVNGETAMYKVSIEHFALGENIKVNQSFTMAVIGTKQFGGGNDSTGLLGGDYLKHFDIEFDLEHHLVNLFIHHRCEGIVAYWPHDILLQSKFSFGTFLHSQQPDSEIMIPIEINGQSGKAILDSGAAITAMTWHSARGFGITPETEGVKEIGAMHGIGDRSVGAAEYRIPKIQFGDETISNIFTKIYHPTNDPTTRQMLFGVDFMLKNRVYIAYDEQVIYFTPYHYRLAPEDESATPK